MSTFLDVSEAQACMCAWLLGQLSSFDVTTFGDENALTVTATLDLVRLTIRAELLSAAAGQVRQ